MCVGDNSWRQDDDFDDIEVPFGCTNFAVQSKTVFSSYFFTLWFPEEPADFGQRADPEAEHDHVDEGSLL